MNQLKAGVLTFHRCINYGSYWQARCLAEGMQSLGYHTVLLDHHSGKINLAEWKCAYQPILPLQTPEDDYPLYRKKIEGFFKAFEALPLSQPFDIDEPEQAGEYDIVVVGSDEVWNLFHPWYGRHKLFFGEGLLTDKLISYAASFGNYDACWQLEPEWKNMLMNFDSISVRDENSQTIIRNNLGLSAELSLDPCLQFPVNAEERENKFGLHYAAVYGHNFSASFIEKIKAWAFDSNVSLVSIGYRNDWADEQWIDADPHDFANFMSGAVAVVTNFFHGCVFALKNEKPFVCETTPYRGNKLKGLLAKTGSEKHLVCKNTPAAIISQRLNKPLDPAIFKNIQQLQTVSQNYLQKALELQPELA